MQAHPRGLWYGFVIVHAAVFLALTPLMIGGGVSGDLPLYRIWATGALSEGVWPVLDFAWVYPAGALVPIVLADVLGGSLYQLVWLLMLTVANALSLWLLTDRGRRTVDATAAWWWLLVLLLLSPVAFLRLEGFSAPLVVAGLVLLARHPRTAGVLLAVATWIKVWPAAVIAAVGVTASRRTSVLWAGVGVTGVVAGVVVVAGGATHLDSFITMQADRRLQVEAPLATPWVWMAMLRVPGASVYENVALATREVMGPGDWWATNASTTLMFAVLLTIVGLLAIARFGVPGGPRPVVDETDLVLRGALALTCTFVVLNKVGSPQYMLWIAPVVAVGLLLRPEEHRTPAVLTAWAAGLTTLVFPLLYRPLLDLHAVPVGVLGVRNLLVVLLFGWSVLRVVEAVLPALGLEERTLAGLVGARRASGR